MNGISSIISTFFPLVLSSLKDSGKIYFKRFTNSDFIQGDMDKLRLFMLNVYDVVFVSSILKLN